MKKKTFCILLAVWILALATFVGLISCSLNKDNDDGNVSTPPATEQGSGNNGGSGDSGNDDGNGDLDDDEGGNVYGDDGNEWIGG